ncbi:unnamed protein product [Mycena citricolor]|uniref:Uncharacterized protein n=1 Tax=Mycena citricolor TaxID=2018698 RepID=A0AAD2JYU8_9AGAR|nr:unnamed protein product [Mycena citricolor]
MFDGDLLGVLDVSMRALPTQRQECGSWVLNPVVVEKWASLEGFLSNVATALRGEIARLVPAPSCGAMNSRPISYGYANPFSTQEMLITAVSHSKDAFSLLLSAIALYFLALDGSARSSAWRSNVMKLLGIHPRSMDSLEDVVQRLLRHPAGMILDCTSESPRELDWLFSMLIKATTQIHVPIYFFLGEGDEAVTRASHLEAFPAMRNLSLEVGHRIRALNQLPAVPVATEEFVFVKANMRLFGTIPNPEYYAALKTEQRQFPPVEPHSGQKEGESYEEFFARCKTLNKRRLSQETDKDRQTRLQREHNAKSQSCPGKKGARVFIWEEVDKFWVRRLVQRNEVEEEWVNFAQSQRIYDSFRNEWDLCKPLDLTAQAIYDDDDDDDFCGDGDIYGGCFAGFDADFEDDLPVGLTARVQSTLNDPSSILQHVDSYYDGVADKEQLSIAPEINSADLHPTRAILEYRVGLVDSSEQSFTEAEMISLNLGNRFLGHGESSTPKPLRDPARALLLSLTKAKRLQEMPSDLFDLCNEKIAKDILSKSGISVTLIEGVRSSKVHGTTGYVLKPADQGASGREVLTFSGTTVMQLMRRRCSTWSEIISNLYNLGATFHIVVEASTYTPSSYQPSYFHCRGLGVRAAGYIPDQHDLDTYWDLLKRFLLSPRGSLALQAGGVVARLARLIINNSQLELRSDDVDIKLAEQRLQINDSSFYFHALTEEEEDLVLGVYSIEINQLNPRTGKTSGHQEQRLSWWPQGGAFFTSGMSVGWWTPDCERWFQEVLRDMAANKALVLNNSRWKHRIRGYNSVGRIAKNLDTVCDNYLTNVKLKCPVA